MGQRLTQIATRTGDDGSTGLGDGTRVPKDHLRVMAMGDVDELNSGLGVLLAEPLPDDVRELLVVIQHELFNLGGELSIPGYQLLKPAAVLRLDDEVATGRLILLHDPAGHEAWEGTLRLVTYVTVELEPELAVGADQGRGQHLA